MFANFVSSKFCNLKFSKGFGSQKSLKREKGQLTKTRFNQISVLIPHLCKVFLVMLSL